MINIMSYLRNVLIKSLYDKINNIKIIYKNILIKYLPNEQHKVIDEYMNLKVFISVSDL